MTGLDEVAVTLAAVDQQIDAQLAPLVRAIDEEGLYPRDYLRLLGRQAGFGADIAGANRHGLDLVRQLAITTSVARTCGSTAFLVWCQSTCVWYLQHAMGDGVRERYLERVASGELLCGTGMSNSVKHLAGIEKIRLNARRVEKGYRIDGVLPWVSNVGADHLVIVAARVDEGGYIMFAVECSAAGLALHPCPEFSGMEGTATLNLRFNDVVIEDAQVLAHAVDFEAYMQRIKPGFVIGQAAMGFGVVEGCLQTLRESNASHSHVNGFLDDQEATLVAELAQLRAEAERLAAEAMAGDTAILPVLRLRAAASELALRAANSAVLHAGARGYLKRHRAQRQLREAVFVSIVTPALKHLRKVIYDLEMTQQEAVA